MSWMNATEVRKRWSEAIDSVVRQKPLRIKRNRDELTLFSFEQLEGLLSKHELRVSLVKEPDGSFTGLIEELDLVANASTKDQLLQQLLVDVIEYSDEYMENFNLYFNSPNRKAHFPYIYKVYLYLKHPSKIQEMIRLSESN